MGVLTGLVFSINTLVVDFGVRKVKYPPDQLPFDGFLMYGLVLIPLFFIEFFSEDSKLDLHCMYFANVAIVC